MPELLRHLPRNVLAIFSGRNLLWHALAVVLTILIVTSGFDWIYYQTTRGEAFYLFARPAILLGTFLPVLSIIAIWLAGEVWKKHRIVTTAWALGQAALLGYFISCFYKVFTGRLPPPFRSFHKSIANNRSIVDSSHGFQLGFLKGGVFWGWPSSHTTVAFAMSACLIVLYPRNKILVALSALYAIYIGLGVSVSIHWFSEFIAGAIIGSMIGMVVGKSFKNQSA